MKVISLLLLLLVSSINNLEYTGHEVVLNDAKTTVDGETVSSSQNMEFPIPIQFFISPNPAPIYYQVLLMANFQFQFREKLI